MARTVPVRILVTGAAGTVGSYVEDVFHDWDGVLTDRENLDVTRHDPLAEVGYGFDAVLHLAAATDVDWCEEHSDDTYRVNAHATGRVAAACAKHGVPLVYVSTAGVFGGNGDKGPFNEDSRPFPANVYGRSKLMGDRIATAAHRKLYIVRAGWMFGGDPATDPKFVGKMWRQMQTEDTVYAVGDKFGSPTYARDLLVGIRGLLERSAPFGVYHMATAGACSRWEMAVAIAKLGGFDCTVEKVTSDRFPLPAPRADSEAITTIHTPQFLWLEALAEHLTALVRQ